MNLIHRVLAYMSTFISKTSTFDQAHSSQGIPANFYKHRQMPKFVLFDAGLYDLKVPIARQPVNTLEAYNLHPSRARCVSAFSLVEKYFELVGIFEDGSAVSSAPSK